jgi:mRNA degradation ribonuclease J1/J2
MMLVAALFAGQQALDRNRHQIVSAQQSFTIGDFQITPFVVDHSAFGALAFLVEADGKSLLYSGDLRWHGRKPGMMKTIIEQIAPTAGHAQVHGMGGHGNGLGHDRRGRPVLCLRRPQKANHCIPLLH